jgi:hypothetical protein
MDRVTRTLMANRAGTGRRQALAGLVAGVAASAQLRNIGQAKKGKKKKKCRKTPQGFCAGKNLCSTVTPPNCNRDGDPCRCYIRSDAGHIGESICGRLIQSTVTTCEDCADGQMCILMGGLCPGAFACVLPCPDPL